MKILVSKGDTSGRLAAPASKSYTIRGLMCAALAQGESRIISPLISDDTEAALNVLGQIGAGIRREPDDWRINGGSFHKPETILFCGDSAATLRFMAAICSQVPGECRLVPGPSLAQRPVKTLIQALRQLGVDCSAWGDFPPVIVQGGKLTGGNTELPGNVSSQFISALLLLAPLTERGLTIKITTPLESKPFVTMTLDCLEKFGIKVEAAHDLREFNVAPQPYKPAEYRIEGDWSSASYFLALGALAGPVTVTNLNPLSAQGDKIMLDFLKDMGAQVGIDKDTVTVRKSELRALKTDLTDYIDLLPTAAVLAAVADGVSELGGIERARIKESNRVTAVREGLEKMGIAVREEKNRLVIEGGTPRGAVIDSKNDHRIAMAFGVLGTVAGETVIDDAGCVSKTFPDFWEALESIGGKVARDE
jgi:3-phosphoshikimate 1-carboxyvinyltransferase